MVVVLYGIDNICFVSVDEDMRSGPPYRGKDGKFHAHGTLEVVSGVLFDILSYLKDVVSACLGRKLVIVTPICPGSGSLAVIREKNWTVWRATLTRGGC